MKARPAVRWEPKRVEDAKVGRLHINFLKRVTKEEGSGERPFSILKKRYADKPGIAGNILYDRFRYGSIFDLSGMGHEEAVNATRRALAKMFGKGILRQMDERARDLTSDKWVRERVRPKKLVLEPV